MSVQLLTEPLSFVGNTRTPYELAFVAQAEGGQRDAMRMRTQVNLGLVLQLLQLLLFICTQPAAAAASAVSFPKWYQATYTINRQFSNGPKASCTFGARCVSSAWGQFYRGGAESDGSDHTAIPDELVDPAHGEAVLFVTSTADAFAALKADGSVAVWGWLLGGGARSDGVLDDGQSYNGAPSDVTSPGLGAGVVAIAASVRAFAAIKEDGSVSVWGDHQFGGATVQVLTEVSGLPTSLASAPATDNDKVVSIAATTTAFAALKADGTVSVWGAFRGGAATESMFDFSPPPNEITTPSPGKEVLWITANENAFAAITSSGSAAIWGARWACGAQNDDDLYTAAPSDVISPAPGMEVIAIASTRWAFAVLKADGSVSVCGDRAYGGSPGAITNDPDLYSGMPSDIEHPIAGAEVVHIAATWSAFAALKADGSVTVWGSLVCGGSTVDGDLYTGLPSELANPPAGGAKVVTIVGNQYSFVALKDDGSVAAWGSRDNGGELSSAFTSIAISNDGSSFKAWAASIGAFAFLQLDGGVAVWGDDWAGTAPTALHSPSYDIRVTAIASTHYSSAVVRADGSVEVWGNAQTGGATNAGTDYTAIPWSVNSPSNYKRTVSIAASYGAFVALIEVSKCPIGSVAGSNGCIGCNSGAIHKDEDNDQCSICPAGTYTPECNGDSAQPLAHTYDYEGNFDLWGRTLRLDGEDGVRYTATPGVPTSLERTCCGADDFHDNTAFTELSLWDGLDSYNMSLPFAYTLAGSSWTSIYISRHGYVSFQPQIDSTPATLERHWAVPKVSGLYADYTDGRVFVASTDDLVAVAFVNLTTSDGRMGSFTLALSSGSYAQITFHDQSLPAPLSSGITGVSAGTSLTTEDGWTPTDFLSCLGVRSCSACEDGTMAVREGSSECKVCPGDGCSGHGECDVAQGCLCEPLYFGIGCEERQNVEASMAFGFIALFIMLGLAVQCICRGKEQEFVKSMTKRTLDPALWQVVVNMEVARRFKNIIVQKSALAVLYDLKLKWAAPLTPARLSVLKLCAAALWDAVKLASILLAVIFFNYIVLFIQMLGNVFLLAKGFFSDNVQEFEEQIDHINDAISAFFSQFHFRWLADISINVFDVLRHINFKFLALDSMDVTCDGSQAPIVLFSNLLIILAILTLLRLNVFPFLTITLNGLLGTVSDMMGIKRMMGQPGSRVVIALWAIVLTGAEGLFKYCVQLLASLMDYDSFFPYHKSNVNCDDATSDVDTTLAILSTILAYTFGLPAIHVVLRTVVPGIPRDAVFRHVSKQTSDPKPVPFIRRVLSRSTTKSSTGSDLTDTPNTAVIDRFRPNDPDLDTQWVFAHKSFQEHKAARHKSMTMEPPRNVPDISELCSLIWHDYKSSSTMAEATTTLRLYLYCMAWKVWKLIQITFGYWDDDAIEAFNIKPLAEKFDDDISDDNLHHSSMMSVIGVAHTLAWQFFSSTVVLAKLGEAVNEDEHSPFIVAKHSDLTVTDTWSGDYVRLTPGGPVKEAAEEREASGKIVAVLQRRAWPAPEELVGEQTDEEGLKDARVPFVLRGISTAFTEEVEEGDIVAICHVGSGEVAARFTVDSIVNDAVLYASIPAEEARELPADIAGKVVDYDIDDNVVTEFNRSKQQADMKRRRRLHLSCCRSRRDDPAVAPDVPEKTRRPQFAAEVDRLSESATAFEYRIVRGEESEPRWKTHIATARNVFSGRFYKCLIRVVRFIIEVGFVIRPSSTWLASFVVLAFPSTLMESLRMLRSCGVTHNSLSAFWTFPLFEMLCCPTPGCWQRWIARNLSLGNRSISVADGIAAANEAIYHQTAAAAQAVVNQTNISDLNVNTRVGFMSRLGRGLMQQLQNQFSVQGVLLGERTDEMEMVEDVIECLQENTAAVNHDAAAEATNIREAMSELVRNARPPVSGSLLNGAPAEQLDDVATDAHSVVNTDDVSDVESIGAS